MGYKKTLKNGFSFVIKDENLDNYELLEALAQASSDNALASIKAIDLLLGEKQKKSLINYLKKRDEKNICRTSVMLACIGEIFELLKEEKDTKN